MSIYYVSPSFNQTTSNPYDRNLPYTDKWIMFKLLESADFKYFTGGGADEIFRLIVTKENIDWPYRLYDFIQYESSQNKSIIIAADKEDIEYARHVYENHSYIDKFLRSYEQRVLVHTTTKENYTAIMQDGCLKSWNILKNYGTLSDEKPIGHLLGDPPNYSNYIMFSHGGISTELVVSSKQKNRLEMDIDTPYVAGARFYFDAQKIAKDGLLIRDGAHLKVKDSLQIDKYILWVARPNVLGIPEYTTPRIFAQKADTEFSERFGLPL